MALPSSEQDQRIERVGRHAAEFLGGLIQAMERHMKEAEPVRNRILADLKALNEDASAADRERIREQIAQQTQRAFAAAGVKVGVDDGCVGRGGGGITATQGGVTVKGCVIVDGLTVQGGGVEVTSTY